MPETGVTKRIYFVRHGETTGNRDFISQTYETPLTDAGHLQAVKVAERVSKLDFETIISSDMQRALETAKYISEAKKIEVDACSLFHEKFTPLNVRNKSIESEEYKEYASGWEENFFDPNWALPGSESFNDLMERADEAVRYLLDSRFKDILVVTHGTFLKHLCARMIFGGELTPKVFRPIYKSFHPDNTGITFMKWNGERWRLITWNDIAHFAE
jgi:probable phosphoglycerate mutase